MRNRNSAHYETAFAYHTQGSAAANAVAIPQKEVPRRQPVPTPEPVKRPQVVPARRPAPVAEPSRASRFWLVYAGLLILAAFLLGQVVKAYSELTVLAVENSAMKREITELQKEQSALALVQNERISLAEIEAIARDELEMVRLSDKSVSLLKSQGNEQFVVLNASESSESIGSLLWKTIKDGALYVWRFIN